MSWSQSATKDSKTLASTGTREIGDCLWKTELFNRNSSSNIVLYRTVLYCIILYSTVLNFTLLYCCVLCQYSVVLKRRGLLVFCVLNIARPDTVP